MQQKLHEKSAFDHFFTDHPKFGFVLSGLFGIILIISFLWMTLFFGLKEADAQVSADCSKYPLQGATQAIGILGVSNTGAINFDMDAKYPPNVEQKACAEPAENGEWKLKGWAWNNNIGWISFFCPGEGKNNLGAYCGDVPYGVKIDANGIFSGYAWSEAGWISFNCSDQTAPDPGCAKSNYKVSLKAAQGGFREAQGYVYFRNLGWASFDKVKIPMNPQEPPDKKCYPGKDGQQGDPCPDQFQGGIPDADGDGYAGISYEPDQAPVLCPVDPTCPPKETLDCDDLNYDVAPKRPESCNEKDDDCDGLVDEGANNFANGACAVQGPPDPVQDAVGVTFNKPYLIGNSSSLGDGQNSIGVSVRNDIRNVIFRNVQQLKNGASYQCGVLESVFAFAPADDVFYCKGDVKLGPVANWKGLKTIIVYDGNLFIDGDIYPEGADTQLGIIVLRKDLNNSKVGNVYVSGNVRHLRVQLYADGSIFPAVADENGNMKKDLKTGAPDLDGGKAYNVGQPLFGQLLMQGLFVARNSVDEYFKGKYFDGKGKDVGVQKKDLAKMYNLGFLRSLPVDPQIPACIVNPEVSLNKVIGENGCAALWNEFSGNLSDADLKKLSNKRISKISSKVYGQIDQNYSVIIIYEPPAEGLPGFSNIAGSSVRQR